MDTTTSHGDGAAPERSLSSRIEQLPRITRSHAIWAAILSLMFVCDIAEINGLSFVAPAIRASWSLSITQVGGLTSYTFLGMFVGAIIGGWLSDRLGRKRILAAAAIFYSICSILSAVAPGYVSFAVLRFLTGVGLQAATGVLLVYAIEMFPRASRGRYLSLMIGIGGLGLPIIAIAARLIVPLAAETWRWVLALGAMGLVPGVLVAMFLPESVRWQELHGQADRAEALVARLEADVLTRTGQPLPALAPQAPEVSYRLTDLGGGRYLRRTTVVCLTMAFGMIGYYGFVTWVPTLLVDRGYSTADALTVSVILASAPVVGALAALPIIDRWQRRRTSLVLCVVIAVAMLVFAFTRSYVVLVVAGFCATVLLQTNAALLYAYLPEVFPTALRGIGSGLGNGVGRLAGVASGFVIAAIAGWAGFGAVFATTAVFVLISGLVVCLFGQDTHSRGLNDTALPPDRISTPGAGIIGPSRAP